MSPTRGRAALSYSARMADSPDPGRSLREVFESLAGDPGADPAAALAAGGHDGLPPDLLTEAITSYADTAPPEVAEHLAPVILGTGEDPALGLELLTTAPQVTWDDVPLDDVTAPAAAAAGTEDDGADAAPDLDFGAGGDTVDDLDAAPEAGADAAPDDAADVVADIPVTTAAPAEEQGDDLPHADLAGEGWDDAAWDADGAPDDDLLDG
jgi:hypothetical protein